MDMLADTVITLKCVELYFLMNWWLLGSHALLCSGTHMNHTSRNSVKSSCHRCCVGSSEKNFLHIPGNFTSQVDILSIRQYLPLDKAQQASIMD